MQKKYREQYTEHMIRHPKDHVSYGNFRWRVKNRGEKLAIRLGKFEGAPKLEQKFEQRKAKRQSIHLLQKQEAGKRERRKKVERIALGITLFLLGMLIGRML